MKQLHVTVRAQVDDEGPTVVLFVRKGMLREIAKGPSGMVGLQMPPESAAVLAQTLTVSAAQARLLGVIVDAMKDQGHSEEAINAVIDGIQQRNATIAPSA